MTLIIKDRVRDTTTTTGTGALTVSGTAPIKFRTFSAVMSNGDTSVICIQHDTADEWEVCETTFDGTTGLTRGTLLASSTGSRVDFSAGTKQVWIDFAADKMVDLDRAQTLSNKTFSDNLNLANTTTPLVVQKNTTNPTAADTIVGGIQGHGLNSSGTDVVFADVLAYVGVNTAGSERGYWAFRTRNGSSGATERARFEEGIYHPSATGGDKGNNSINFGSVYQDGAAVATVNRRKDPGEVFWFAASTPPTGSLECNGNAVSRTTYAALFSAIGTTFGSGDGSTTFNLPDLRGQFIRGYDHSAGVDSGRSFGSDQTDALQNITGTLTMQTVRIANVSTAGAFSASSNASVAAAPGSNAGTSVTFDASNVARTASETRPTNVALLPCIAY